MSLVVDLAKFPLHCIYILVDESNDNAYLQWSNGNAIEQLANTINDLRRGIHSNIILQNSFNRKKLSIRILKEYDAEIPDIIIRTESIMLFKNTKLMDITGKYNRVIYSFQKSVLTNYAGNQHSDPLVYITLKGRNVVPIVLAVFDTMIAADEWINRVYPKDVEKLVFSGNVLTREYHKKYGYKLI